MTKIRRMLEQARETQAPPGGGQVIDSPARFARDPSEFTAHTLAVSSQ